MLMVWQESLVRERRFLIEGKVRLGWIKFGWMSEDIRE